jgi:chemotaxis protein MotD
MMRVIDMAGVQAVSGRPPLGKDDASEAKNAFGDLLDRETSPGKARGKTMTQDMPDEATSRSKDDAGAENNEMFPPAASPRPDAERSDRGLPGQAAGEASNADAGTASRSDADDREMRLRPAGRARIDWLALRMPKGEDASAAEPDEPRAGNVVPVPPADDASVTISQNVTEELPDARLAASGPRRDERSIDERERPSIRTEASRGNVDVPARMSTPDGSASAGDAADPGLRDIVSRSKSAAPSARQPFASASGEQAPDPSARPVATLSVQTVPAFAASLQSQSQTVVGALRDEVPELARPAPTTVGQPQTAEPMRVLKIQLHPLELGVVTARLSLQGGEMSVELQTETREAASRLSVDSNEIAKALRGLGIEIDRVTVTQQPSGNMQPQGQQTGSERSGERFANEGDAGGRQNGQRSANNGAGGFEGERNAGDSQSSRGVYI